MPKKPGPEVKPLTIEVAPELHKAVKRAATDKGGSLKDFITPLLKKAVNWKE